MQENSLAKRYARGLARALTGEGEYEHSCRELSDFAGLLASHEQLKLILETAIVAPAQKMGIMIELLEKMDFHPKTRAFLKMLAQENRVAILGLINEQLVHEWEEAQGIERISVFSASALDGGQRRRLQDILARAFAKKVILEARIDPSLLAGIKLQRGSVVYDFSLLGNLERLKERLIEER